MYIEDVFFIDKDGNKISDEHISSHIGLAYTMIEKDEELKKEFENSGERNPLIYLIINKGYMTFSEMGSYRKVVCNSRIMTEKQKDMMEAYKRSGFQIEDFALQLEEYEKQGKGEER